MSYSVSIISFLAEVKSPLLSDFPLLVPEWGLKQQLSMVPQEVLRLGKVLQLSMMAQVLQLDKVQLKVLPLEMEL